MLNDEVELLDLLTDVLALGEDVSWAVDVADGMAALWINILFSHGQHLVYIPGLAVNRASAGYRGVGKTDLKGRDRHSRPGSDATRPHGVEAG